MVRIEEVSKKALYLVCMFADAMIHLSRVVGNQLMFILSLERRCPIYNWTTSHHVPLRGFGDVFLY